jgi:CheY-like chemotaxis protein
MQRLAESDGSRPLRVLLVDDNPGDRDLAADRLQHAAEPFDVLCAASLKEAMERLKDEEIDVALLDLGLPDSQGLDTFRQLQAYARDIPIVILTGAGDDAMAHEALNAGAQDYLVKDWTDANLTGRSLRYAVERKRLYLQLEHERKARESEREKAAHEWMTTSASTSVTARLFGQKPLRESARPVFDEIAHQYAGAICQALENRVTKAQHAVSDTLRVLAERLGSHSAGPRDVVDLHKASITHLSRGANVRQVEAYADEGRLLLLELMGHLVSFYRTYFTGVRLAQRNGITGSAAAVSNTDDPRGGR